MAYTVAQILQIANVAQFLSADDESKSNLFIGWYERYGLSRLIYIVKNAVTWINTYNPSSNSLVGRANYLLSLCQPFIGRALQILGSGGSGTIVNPSTGVVSTIVAQTVEFRIGDVGALMIAGQSSLVLNYANILNSSISIVLDGVPLPINLNDRVSFTPIYTNPNVTVNFNQPCVNGQVYVIMFLQYVTV